MLFKLPKKFVSVEYTNLHDFARDYNVSFSEIEGEDEEEAVGRIAEDIGDKCIIYHRTPAMKEHGTFGIIQFDSEKFDDSDSSEYFNTEGELEAWKTGWDDRGDYNEPEERVHEPMRNEGYD